MSSFSQHHINFKGDDVPSTPPADLLSALYTANECSKHVLVDGSTDTDILYILLSRVYSVYKYSWGEAQEAHLKQESSHSLPTFQANTLSLLN